MESHHILIPSLTMSFVLSRLYINYCCGQSTHFVNGTSAIKTWCWYLIRTCSLLVRALQQNSPGLHAPYIINLRYTVVSFKHFQFSFGEFWNNWGVRDHIFVINLSINNSDMFLRTHQSRDPFDIPVAILTQRKPTGGLTFSTTSWKFKEHKIMAL